MKGLDQDIADLFHDLYRYRYVVVTAFILINVVAVSLGLAWPKSYTASSTIYVEEKNIIQPLMKDAAVTTNVVDRARLAREILFSRRILDDVMTSASWTKGTVSDLQKEKMMEDIKARTNVRNVGKNLVKVEVKTTDAKRAYETAKKFAEVFVAESLGTQSNESAAAFDFIDSQVKEYHAKLIEAEQALKEFRSQNVDARPGTDSQVAAKITTLQNVVEKTSLELKELQIKQASIEKQLSGEAEVTASVTKEGQLVSHIAELQGKLENLRLSYHDTYPDIVHLKQQIDDLKEAVIAERHRREAARLQPRTGDQAFVDEGVRINPIYQKLRAELLETRTLIETLSTRLHESKKRLAEEIDRARRVHGGEAALAELTRDYEVNRDIYQDLLRRREKARVSRNLNEDKQGLTLNIQEPAVLPLQPSGIRFLHIMVFGFLLSIIVPPGLLIAWQKINPWIRSPLLISDKLKLPLLVTIPHLSTPAEEADVVRGFGVIAMAGLVTVGFVAGVAALRFFALV